MTAIPINKTAVLGAIKRIQTIPKEDKENQELKSLQILSRSKGWKNLKKTIEMEIERLDQVNNIDEGDTIETIGIKFVASQLAKEKLEWVINSVNATNE